jgi:hypothetical protein
LITMVKRMVGVLLGLVLLPMPSLAQTSEWDITPLPPELSDYYQRERNMHRPEWIFYELGRPEDIFSGERNMVLHDIGEGNESTSKLAKEYLLSNVIQPLRERKSLHLQDGKVIQFDELSRLTQAQLMYYFVRDYILYPHPEEFSGVERTLKSLPYVGVALSGLPSVLKYPCETVSSCHGLCNDQAMLLAALLRLCGYDVALGFFASMGRELDGRVIFLSYHNYVLLKDEGWGVGRWELRGDGLGNPMIGKWIILDPICSPRHAPYMEMVGCPHKALVFGEDPGWTKLIHSNFVNLSPCGKCANPFWWGVL